MLIAIENKKHFILINALLWNVNAEYTFVQ